MGESFSISTAEAATERHSGPTVQEQQIDFLLEEEFSAGLDFLKRFIELAERSDTPVELAFVGRSVSDSFGEADLVVIYRGENRERVAILLEDKINAAFQPGQADRYRIRGKAGLSRDWDSFWTCLVAPEDYIKRGHGFEYAVSLESIQDWFKGDGGTRGQFKAGIIRKAISKEHTTGVQRVDVAVTEFRRRHYECFEKYFEDMTDEVFMRKPADTWAGDTWFNVKSQRLPHGADICHKAQPGFVDLAFPDTETECLSAIEPFIDSDMKIVPTGKSASVRIKVSPIKRFDDFDSVQIKVVEGLVAVKRLLMFYSAHKNRFDSVLGQRAEHKGPSADSQIRNEIVAWVHAPVSAAESRDAVLEVGFEGGSITLFRERVGESWAFRIETNEVAALDMLSEEDREGILPRSKTALATTFQAALDALDKYPWVRAHPLRVHPEYKDAILAAVCERIAGSRATSPRSKTST
ncbi:MAG: hypothetical protein WB341_02325 [Terracidiphilus sp.]